ncbi:DUF2069 domain-containing protein [Pistricoccus aurantiacus]|uniref:DUF2069 domain-containing protein n=1 Tax=Pistricoccus aurantiacus TaxID=1883414 RepID=A0A5B8SUM1_9GAMM|nr:DUF2069 domain-containing protein [Pistricoccus aurantiacus]QEA39994.1 DUF2069 domain-containing protein [Pistricoccus aurantiacus]
MRKQMDRWEQRRGLDSLVSGSRRWVIVCYIVLVLLLCYGGFMVHDVQQGGWGPLLVRVIPLLLFLPAILMCRARSHAWLAFISLLYFMQGVMIATLPGQMWFGSAITLASMGLFIASAGYARFKSRQEKSVSH